MIAAMLTALPLFAAALAAAAVPKDAAKDRVVQALDSQRDAYAEVALTIWRFAEVGYQEAQSSALLQARLREAGFAVESGVAGIPTAFVASWGSGKPVIAFVGEFDALPGLSQQASPERKPIVEGGAGHGCGHHLFGTASMASAIAVKDWMALEKRAGTVRFYGTPAEEGGSGKVYMVRAGLFRDVDAAISWHPGDRNAVSLATTLANTTAKFRFHGRASHAGSAPDKGRSALDGVEAMDFMVNLMREHMPSDARIHYVITRGGEAPNVVPDFAEVYYYARHEDIGVLDDLWARILKAAEGAALGTGTTVEHEIMGAVYPVLPNEALAALYRDNLRRVGGYRYTPEEQAFAETLRRTLPAGGLALGTQEGVQPDAVTASGASTDMGDVSWNVPTVQLTAATWVPGTPAHSWQAVAAGGTGIGVKGMLVAAKTMALTGIDLFRDPSKLAAARAEFDRRRAGHTYRARLGDRLPALDYRKD
jgi:aminobenzoyl-glutamate utilization protein B